MSFSLSRAAQKALVAHPAFMDRSVPVSVYAPGSGSQEATISQRNAARHSDAYGGTQAIDWVYDCIGLYSDAASSAPYKLTDPNGAVLVRAKTDSHPPDVKEGPAALYSLLDKPNPFMLYDELMALLVIDLMLVGNGYWFKWQNGGSGQPLALYRLAPSHVKIQPSPRGPKGYEYQPPGANKKLVIDPADIIHFRRPNPHSIYYGMGVIQGGGRAMDLELAITDTIASYYENKADPSMIVQSDRRVPRDVFNKLRAQLRARASGSRKAGELLVLESGLKASSLSASASDALFAQLAVMSRDRVFSKFRASPMLFGLLDESSGSNKVSDIRRDFDNSTLKPFLMRLANLITAELAEAYGVKYAIDHQSTLPADEQIKVAESVAAAPGMKIRDIRRQYAPFGIEESTGDPKIDELVINLPGENLDANGKGVNGGQGQADQPIGTEPGRPPKMENTAAVGTGKPGGGVAQGKALEDLIAELEERASGKAVSTPAPDNRLPNEVRPDDTFAVARTADINAAMNVMTAGLSDAAVALERALLDQVEGKALKTSDIVRSLRNSKAWSTFREQVAEVLLDGARRAAASGVMHSGLTPNEEIDYDEIANDIVWRPEGIKAIVKTLRDRVVKSVRDARATDAERHDYQDAVKETIQDWIANQAQAVGDSEATEAYNEATLVAAEMSGVGSVFVHEEEDAPDEPCQEAAGQVWDIKTARENRKQHPRCRRAFIPMTAEAVG